MFNKNSQTIEDIKKKIQKLEDDIDFIHELLYPSSIELKDDDGDDDYDSTTTEIPAELYDKIREYCENKNYIFMGLA